MRWKTFTLLCGKIIHDRTQHILSKSAKFYKTDRNIWLFFSVIQCIFKPFLLRHSVVVLLLAILLEWLSLAQCVCQDESVVSTEISRLKLQLQTSLSERGVFEMRIGQLADDVKRLEAERDEVCWPAMWLVSS